MKNNPISSAVQEMLAFFDAPTVLRATQGSPLWNKIFRCCKRFLNGGTVMKLMKTIGHFLLLRHVPDVGGEFCILSLMSWSRGQTVELIVGM
ncbi:hypothetical protein Bpfe_002522 [Biomphalaria pfeifferi]|uniref:Uncharacterized protein n=1 Tax=Biomphalaria pfeifferi TaxID=112525 RepID=A0AAD8C9T3_BIOPF|nr:hypothetical protein Bpfe_002522 [Biomphalaria pfeifferi]